MKYSPDSQFCIWLSLLRLIESYLIYSKRGKGKIRKIKMSISLYQHLYTTLQSLSNLKGVQNLNNAQSIVLHILTRNFMHFIALTLISRYF